ncbi:MAG TPA: FG-GAP and VCBS repeat-containing protein, partial [Planctomycetota bacterium]|nr:FG-GAP and VCBS repeat-containing protein [Planctomycetota bacterium]
FFLQDDAGGFPVQPDVTLDLAIFRDAAFEGGVQPGRTLSIEGQATYRSRDLNGDGIPDHVVAHGRKVWVFLAGPQGPQFTEPLSILKTAEDITAVTLARIDDDALPDLVLLKVQVPTIATFLRGLFGEWDVSIGAVGYRNLEGRGFEATPSSRSELVVRLPSIVRILKNPADLLSRFEELSNRFRIVVRGDFDGDGTGDLGLVASDGERLEVWLGSGAGGQAALDTDGALREVFFEASDAVWDLDRILLWLGGVADRQVALETGNRPASFALELRDPELMRLETLAAGDLDGDGRDELVAGYVPTDGGAGATFDVLRLEEGR